MNAQLLLDVQEELAQCASERVRVSAIRFFKTDNGEYSAHDVFIGVRVPDVRRIAKRFFSLSYVVLGKLLQSPIHEHRFTALLILTERYAKAMQSEKEKIASFYLKHIRYVNNWDLVDCSASKILGVYTWEKKDDRVLRELVRHKNLWHRRVGIVASHAFIKAGNTGCTFALAKLLLDDTEDLMHKATGWMLREAGKRDTPALVSFLKANGTKMPRTMLRYAIERFPERERKKWLIETRKK